jgi:hypothetical protein
LDQQLQGDELTSISSRRFSGIVHNSVSVGSLSRLTVVFICPPACVATAKADDVIVYSGIDFAGFGQDLCARSPNFDQSLHLASVATRRHDK